MYLYETPEPIYIPAKSSVDAATEINTGDFIDFDTEVEPILEALIDMTMQQALHEVAREEEWAELQREKQHYLALRELQITNLKLVDINKLDNEDNGITAAKLLHNYVSSRMPDILMRINSDIVLVDKSFEDSEEKFISWLTEEIATEVGQQIDSIDLLEQLIKDIVEKRGENFLNKPSESTLDRNDSKDSEALIENNQ